MSSGGYDSPHVPSSYPNYGSRRSSGQLPASYERPTNPPVRRQSSPGASARRYVPYERAPRAGPSYQSDYPNVYRPNGANVYRPDYDSYYSRSPSPDRYPSASSRVPPEPESWDRPSSWQQAPGTPTWPERKPLPPSPTASLSRERNRGREDVLATRMFEPSDAWKQTHDRPGRGDAAGLSSSENYSDHRSRSNQEHSPERTSRSDRAPAYYQPGGDRYRPAPRQWDSYSPTRPEYNSYRPQYENSSSWTPPYAREPPSPAHSYRRDSVNASHTRTSDHYEPSYNGRHASASRSVAGSLSPRLRDRSPPVRRGRRSPSRDRSHYNGHSAYDSDSSYHRRYDSHVDRDKPQTRKYSSRSSSRSSIASTHRSDSEKPTISSHYPEPILANLGINGPMGRESSKPPGPQSTDKKSGETVNGHGTTNISVKDNKADSHPASPVTAKQQKIDTAATIANDKLPPAKPQYRPLKPAVPSTQPRVPLQANGKTDENIPGLGTIIDSKAPAPQDPKTRPSPKASLPKPPVSTHPSPTATSLSVSTSTAAAAPPPVTVSKSTPIVRPEPPSQKKIEQKKVAPEPTSKSVPKPSQPKPAAMVVDQPPPTVDLIRAAVPPAKPDVPKDDFAAPVPPSNPPPVEPPTSPAVSSSGPLDSSTEIPKLSDAKSINDALRAIVMTRLMCDRQTCEERVNPVLAANRAIAPEPEIRSTTPPEEIVDEMYSGERLAERMKAFEAAKPSLVEFFHQRQLAITEKVSKLSEEYVSLHEKWRAHCAALNAQSKALAAETEVAQPTGRTTRRTAATLTDLVRSDLEMEQIIASLGYDEATDPNHLCLRNVATIPDMICVTKGKVEYLFDDTNNRVENPSEYYAPETGMHDWTDAEREIFIDKFACYPKQFGIIADFLPNKTAAQCVAFYYLHKHRHIDFRKVVSQLAPNKRRRRGTGKKKGNALLADIAQHDAQVQREAGAGSPAGGRSTRGRKGMPPPDSRKPGSTVGRKPASAVLQQLEGTPTSTPTPEPDAPKPKRGRGRPPNVPPASRTVSVSLSIDEGEQDAASDPEVRPTKRQKRTRKVKSAAIISEEADGTSTPMSIATPPPLPQRAKDKDKEKEKEKPKEPPAPAPIRGPEEDKKVLPPLPKRASISAAATAGASTSMKNTAREDPKRNALDKGGKTSASTSSNHYRTQAAESEASTSRKPMRQASPARASAASTSSISKSTAASTSKEQQQRANPVPPPPVRISTTTNGSSSASASTIAAVPPPPPPSTRPPPLPGSDPPMASLSPPPPSFRPARSASTSNSTSTSAPSISTPSSFTQTPSTVSSFIAQPPEKRRELPDILKSWGSIMTRKPPPPPPPSRPRGAGRGVEGRYYSSAAYVPNSPVLGEKELPGEGEGGKGKGAEGNGGNAGNSAAAPSSGGSTSKSNINTNTSGGGGGRTTTYTLAAASSTTATTTKVATSSSTSYPASSSPASYPPSTSLGAMYAQLHGFNYARDPSDPARYGRTPVVGAGAVYGPPPPPGSRMYPTTTVPNSAGSAGAGAAGAKAGEAVAGRAGAGEGAQRGYYHHYPPR